MSCLAEDRFVEILDRGGLDAARPDERAHLESCEQCRDSWATVAAAGEVLVDARPKVARWRIFPVAIAAAMLLSIVGIILFWKTPTPVVKPQDPIVLLLEGSPEEVRSAREALLKQGRKAIPLLVSARTKFKGSARLQALQDLIFDLKRAAVRQDPAAAAVFQKLESVRIDLAFENTMARDILSFIRDFSGLNIHLDATVGDDLVEKFDMRGATLRSVLEVFCALKDLDFDFRYGVLFLATPVRLWSTEKGVGLPAANGWTTQVLSGPDAELRDKLLQIRVSIDMQNAPMSAIADYLTEICGFKCIPAPALAETPININVSDARLSNMLELLTLPRGWDVWIRDGVVKIEAGR